MHKLADLMMNKLSLHELVSIVWECIWILTCNAYTMVVLVNEQLSFSLLMPAYEDNNCDTFGMKF